MAARRTTRAHILVLPYPAQGHIPPLLSLSHHLAAQGALVTLVNIHSIHCRLSQLWSPSPASPGGLNLRSLPFPYHIPFGYDASSHLDQANFIQAIRQAQSDFENLVRQLLEEVQPRVSCLVADYLWGWHHESACKFGMVGASYWPGSATWSTVHYHLPLMISAGDAPIQGDGEKLIEYMPGVSPTRLADFPYYARTAFTGTLEYLMQEQEKTLSSANERSWFLINSAEELEPEAFGVMRKIFGERYVGVGPLFLLNPSGTGIPHGLRDEEGDCRSWLAGRRPKSVLYVSFGSVATLTATELGALAEGLVESEQPFLWVLRQEQEERDLKELISRVDEMRGMVVSWVPQLEVLSHSSVGGFLSHCGWNSVFESLSSGVPLLGWPSVVEQNLNCKLLVDDLKVGLRIERGEKAEIVQLVKEVMRGDSDVRRNAEMVQEKVRRAADQSGSSRRSLELFMDDICSNLEDYS